MFMNEKMELLRLFTLNNNVASFESVRESFDIRNADRFVDLIKFVGYDIKKENDLYRFVPDAVISKEKVLALLENNSVRLHIYDELPSTNDTAMSMAQDALEDKVDYEVIIASRQTRGKGRKGRNFYSPDDTGLYMSIIVRPDMNIEQVTYITAATAVALANAVEYVTGGIAKIKWVNDIFFDNKKVCGILAEASLDALKNSFNYVVVGIGVNLGIPQNGFPDELKDIAGALSKNEIDRSFFAAVVINSFIDAYSNIRSRTFLPEYRRRQFILGKEINVIKQDCVKQAKAVRIDDECRLVVEYPDNITEALYSGEVSVRPVL